MSVAIETTEDLLVLLKKLDVKVTSMDELRSLLMTINANYNPEEARQKTGKLVGITVPTSMAGAAAVTSFFLLGSGDGLTASHVGALALIWSTCAVVSVVALIASFLITGGRRGPTMLDKPPLGNSVTVDERVMAAIGRDLSV